MNLPIVRWIHPKRQGMWLFAIMVATGLVAPALAESPLRDMDAQADGNSSSNRKRLVADHLPLTPSEAEQFWPVYDRFEQEMAILAERRKSLIGKFGENYDAMSDPMAKAIIREYLDFHEAHLKLIRAYLPKFERVLPAKKLIRFFQIEARMRAVVEAEIAEHVPLLQ